MSTPSAIAAAIATQIGALSWVSEASATSYAPASAGNAVCAFVIPFDQQTTAEPANMGGDLLLRHVLTVEFWTQVKSNKIGDAMTTARDAATLAIVRLAQNDGTGYELEAPVRFEERIYPEPVTHAGVPWIISALRVPVTNEVSI